jgi:2',3'-cyclic-nucleotide 2'-phosphodiesterase (5'-nucleotidase family)
MNYKFYCFLIGITLLSSCKKDYHLDKIKGKRVEINDSLKGVTNIEDYIKPFRDHVNKNLDSVIAYSVDTYSKRDGDLNTAIGNLFADATIEMANPVFKKRTGKNIDFVLLNHGGIRSIISKGNVTSRTAFEIMPFENSLVVLTLKGEQVKELIAYLQKAKRAHPISKLNIALDKDYNLKEATINKKQIDYTKTYNVLTNDYLFNGGDRMDFFKTNDSVYILDYKVRNALLDYFKKYDTINPVIDNRFIRIQ